MEKLVTDRAHKDRALFAECFLRDKAKKAKVGHAIESWLSEADANDT